MEKTVLRESEIMLSACGVTEEGIPKCQTMLTLSIIDSEKELEEMEDKFDELLISTACLSLERSVCFTTATLTFQSADEEELRHAKSMLRGFQNFLKNNPLSDRKFSYVGLTIKPDEFQGEYWITMANGAWSVTSSEMDGKLDSIRFIFANDFVRTDRYVEEE